VAILIDEYDKAMLNQFGNTDFADGIAGKFNTFYSIIKACVSARKICLVFLTGVINIAATSISRVVTT
jgi:hypothetical protein